MKSAFLAVLGTALAAPSVFAVDYTWNGNGPGGNAGEWGHQANWTANAGRPEVVAVDNALFLSTTPFTVQPKVTAQGGGAATYAFNGLVFNTTSLTTLSIPTGSALNVTTTRVQQSATISLAGTGAFSTTNLSVEVGTFTIPSVTVSGRLSGAGTIAGNVTVSATGRHSAGGTQTVVGGYTYTPAIGTQTVTGNLTYNSGSIFEWGLNATTTNPGPSLNQGSYDRVNASGAVTGTSAFSILLGTNAFTDAFWDTNKSWDNIFSLGSGSLQSIFTTFTGSVAANGIVANQGQFSFSGNTLNWVAAIPEPSSSLAGLVLCVGLIRRRRN